MNGTCERMEPRADDAAAAGTAGGNGNGKGILTAGAVRPAAGSDGDAAGHVPPGFLSVTLEWGGASVLLHHSEVGECRELRGAHGTGRGTLIRHRTQPKRKWQVTEPLAEIAARLASAVRVERGDVPAGPVERITLAEAVESLEVRLTDMRGGGCVPGFDALHRTVEAACSRGVMTARWAGGLKRIEKPAFAVWEDGYVEGFLEVAGRPERVEWICQREAARRLAARMEPLLPRGKSMPLENARSRVRRAVAEGELPSIVEAARVAISVPAFEEWTARTIESYLDAVDQWTPVDING